MKNQTYILLAVIAALALFRALQWIPNVSPVAAMALFAGATFHDRKLAFVIPLAAMLLSDLYLGLHDTMLYVYGAFTLTIVLGFALKSHVFKALPVLAAAVGSSLLFFLITNFGVWLQGPLYSHDLAGLIECYVAAIPFYRNSLMGDLLFSALLFGGWALWHSNGRYSFSR